VDDGIARQAAEVAGEVPVGLDDLRAEHARGEVDTDGRQGLMDGEDAHDRKLTACLAHERAAALLPADQALRLELAQRLAQRGARDSELFAQVSLRRELVAGPPLAPGDSVAGLTHDLCVQRWGVHLGLSMPQG